MVIVVWCIEGSTGGVSSKSDVIGDFLYGDCEDSTYEGDDGLVHCGLKKNGDGAV